MTSSTEVVREVAPARRQVASADAIEAAYRAQAPRLRRLAAAVAGTDVAGDIVQDAFAAALRRRESWRGEGPLEAWLWRLVLNAAHDAERKRLRRRRLVARAARLLDARAATEVTTDPTLLATLRRLPERQRDCVVLRYYGDQSYAEIARVMGIEVGTVGALLSKAHAALRAEIEREELR